MAVEDTRDFGKKILCIPRGGVISHRGWTGGSTSPGSARSLLLLEQIGSTAPAENPLCANRIDKEVQPLGMRTYCKA